MHEIEFILYVADQTLSRHFYRELLNLEPALDVPGMTEFALAENVKLGLMPESGIAKILQNKTPDPSKGNGIPRCELYLMVEDPKQYLDRGVQAGARIISALADRDWGHTVGYISDPDGHIIAFAGKNT